MKDIQAAGHAQLPKRHLWQCITAAEQRQQLQSPGTLKSSRFMHQPHHSAPCLKKPAPQITMKRAQHKPMTLHTHHTHPAPQPTLSENVAVHLSTPPAVPQHVNKDRCYQEEAASGPHCMCVCRRAACSSACTQGQIQPEHVHALGPSSVRHCMNDGCHLHTHALVEPASRVVSKG
jgi:hypothetical protein